MKNIDKSGKPSYYIIRKFTYGKNGKGKNNEKPEKALCVILAMLVCFSFPALAADSEKPLSYVILGDSIGRGAGVLNSDEAVFGKIVADTDGFAFKNDAVNGYTASDLLRHLEKENIAEDVKNADIISVSIGGNNFLRGNMKELILTSIPALTSCLR